MADHKKIIGNVNQWHFQTIKGSPKRLGSGIYFIPNPYVEAMVIKNDNLETKITMKPLTSDNYPETPVLLDNLSIKFMKESVFVPLDCHNKNIRIAMANPMDYSTRDALEFAYGLNVEVIKGKEDDILAAIERLYGAESQSLATIIDAADKDIYDMLPEDEENIDHLRGLASEAPIIRLVNRLILNAIEMDASDIHFEPFEDELIVRYRIDGVLHKMESPSKRLQAAIVSRVKIMAKMDIAERRLPQDGRIKLKIGEKAVDVRVSTIPVLFGESVVMRILDRASLVLDMEKLGFPSHVLSEYNNLILQPYGMILVTGPTGSGKTSTLYTTLAKINTLDKKIITLEDPIEYHLKGVNQIQVKPKIGLTFSKGLRSIVRQDPDVILVGEIRDRETAETAVQSALTGHLLFSTLHTNDASSAVTRLLEMNVKEYLINSSLLGALAQRLVRVLCPFCKIQAEPEKKLVESMGINLADFQHGEFYKENGCKKCRGTGFKGRIGIFEFLKIDDEIRGVILKDSSAKSIRNLAIAKGMVTLKEDGWSKVMQGITTISEVMRVTLDQ